MAIALGLQRLLHDIRHHRERFRQFLGIAFIILVSSAGEPKGILFVPGALLVMLGIAARLWASGHIKKNKVLATDGPYAYVRHPLYVGNLIPRLTPYRPGQRRIWSFRQSLRHNGEPVIALFLLFWLYFLYSGLH
jgi:protein-S-isoprenylcysteine O-methyltransferase Ste14